MRTGRRDIFTIAAAGGERISVTDDAEVDWNPVWSPDGTSLFFLSDRGGNMNIWRVPIDEKSGEILGLPTAITTGAAANLLHLSLSRDQVEAVYVAQISESNLWRAPFDSHTHAVVGAPVPITQGSRRADFQDVSPDGQWLVFRSYGGSEDICLMRNDGTERRCLTDDSARDSRPRWSPDGEQIAFQSNRSGNMEIWIIHPDGSGLEQISQTGQNASYLAWSPDGKRMSYYNSTENASYVFDLDKTWNDQFHQKLPPFGDEEEGFCVCSWSPDGRWLTGYVRSPRESVGIVVYSLESRQYKRLTDFGAFPEWTNDSRGVIFQKRDGSGLYLVAIESGDVHELLSLSPDGLHLPTLSPDNQWIYFERVKNEADIWMLSLNEEQE
jgi:TolB protein